MTIEEVVNLWKESKYRYLFLQSLPVVREDKEVVNPSAMLERNNTYCLGKEMSVFEYLITIHKRSLYYFKEIKEDTLMFVEIVKKLEE